MTIIIKEISIRATIERASGPAAGDERRFLRLKKDVAREVREMLRKEQQRKKER